MTRAKEFLINSILYLGLWTSLALMLFAVAYALQSIKQDELPICRTEFGTIIPCPENVR